MHTDAEYTAITNQTGKWQGKKGKSTSDMARYVKGKLKEGDGGI